MEGPTERMLLPKPLVFQPVEMNRVKLSPQSAGFQFVNLHNGQQLRPSSESQTMIRSQAMKSFLRRGRSEIMNGNEVNSRDLERMPKVKQKDGEAIMFRLLPKDMQELPKRARKKRRVLDKKRPRDSKFHDEELRSQNHTDMSLNVASNIIAVESIHIQDLGSGNLDPFHSLPFPITERTQYLIRYSAVQITASPLMFHLKKKWFTLALKDEAYFHAALSHYSGHLFLTQGSGRGDPVEAVFHRAESVRILNERLLILQDGKGVSDGTIGAVACMVNYEASNGRLESVKTHMSGLEQMVNIRGGLEEGDFPMYLHRLVAWADVNSAFALSTTPILWPIPSGQSTFDSYYTRSTYPANLDFIMNDLRRLASTSPDQNMHSSMGATHQSLLVRHADDVSYSDILYHCKRVLLFISLSNESHEEQSFVKRALADAALLLTEIWGRGTRVNATIVDTGFARLKISLWNIYSKRMLSPDSVGDSGSEREWESGVFWATFVGLVIAHGREEKPWLLRQISQLSRRLGIETWKDVEETLGTFLWCGIWEAKGRGCWEEI